jgi:hypothetical protein
MASHNRWQHRQDWSRERRLSLRDDIEARLLARTIERWAIFAVSIVAVAAFGGFIFLELHHLFGGIASALTLH